MLRLSRLGLVLLTGCSIVVDGELVNRGETADCDDAVDGTACGSGLICLDGECEPSICGDGFVDVEDGEECDDENRVDDDGCDADCTFSCVADVDCGEGVACGGSPSCDLETHACVVSDPPADGSACDLEGEEGVCRAGECVSAGCGNGLLEGDEVCDDGNDVERDGCDNDCTLSCLEDVDCVDETVCNGSETCDTTTNACVAGEHRRRLRSRDGLREPDRRRRRRRAGADLARHLRDRLRRHRRHHLRRGGGALRRRGQRLQRRRR